MKINNNLIISLIIMGIALLFFYQTYSFPNVNTQDTGPAFMPRIYAGVLMLLGIFLFFSSFKSVEESQEKNTNLVFIIMGILFIYILLIPIIGFYIVTPIYLFVFLWIVAVRNVIVLISIPIITTSLVFLFFQKLLNVPIPLGLLL